MDKFVCRPGFVDPVPGLGNAQSPKSVPVLEHAALVVPAIHAPPGMLVRQAFVLRLAHLPHALMGKSACQPGFVDLAPGPGNAQLPKFALVLEHAALVVPPIHAPPDMLVRQAFVSQLAHPTPRVLVGKRARQGCVYHVPLIHSVGRARLVLKACAEPAHSLCSAIRDKSV